MFIPYRDNSMGRNTLRFKVDWGNFTFKEARVVSDKAIELSAKLADQLEIDLKDVYKADSFGAALQQF